MFDTTDNEFTYDSNKNLKRIYDYDNLLDMLIDVDSTLDNFDLYAFKNWIKGEIVSGPKIKRYWIEIILKYNFNEMPDPTGGVRLTKHGIKVFYKKHKEKVFVNVESADDLDPNTKAPKQEEINVWLVFLKIPRRFISDLNTSVEEFDDEDEVDMDQAQEAEEKGLDNEGLENDLGAQQDMDQMDQQGI